MALLEEVQILRHLPDRLSQQADWQRLLDALHAGNAGTVEGAWGSSQALVVSTLLAAAPGSVVVLLPRGDEVDGFIDDLRSLTTVAPCPFPALEEQVASGSRRFVDRDLFGRRLAVLKAWQTEMPPRLVVAGIQAVLQAVPSAAGIQAASRKLTVGQHCDRDDLLDWLQSHEWTRREAVELPGEFSIRGGIVDLFPIDADHPLRLEFFGDQLDSIRVFSVESQRSLRELQTVAITATVPEPYLEKIEPESSSAGKSQPAKRTDRPDLGHLADWLPNDTWIVFVDPVHAQQEADQFLKRQDDLTAFYSFPETWQKLLAFSSIVVATLPQSSRETAVQLRMESVERLSGEITKLRDEIDQLLPHEQLYLACANQGEQQRLRELLGETRLATEGRLHLPLGRIQEGFRWVDAGIVVLSDAQLLQRTPPRPGETPTTANTGRRRVSSKAIDSFLDLNAGDYVVHLSHGIGIYRGIKQIEKNNQLEDHLCVEFADDVLMYVPASKIDLVQKYIGGSHAQPNLSKVGGQQWERRKAAAQRAVVDLAAELIDLQAARQAQAGFAFPPDSEWQREFEAAFPYTETPDQRITIEEIRADMERARPMDRLICGDVGFGKTELAMRAAFKAADAGKQVAVLVPTTVLAVQHLRSFRERMAEFPFRIEALTRFLTRGEQKELLAEAAAGKVDILIGTHRLLSKDVAFLDLGLVIIDEEQRFGVEHKERLKKLRSKVDLLTLSATPIPRTLHASLLGIRDISNLETPPPNRLAVETRICRFDEALLRHAMLRELNRGGQIFFVHNRIAELPTLAKKLQFIVPEVRLVTIHGKMSEEEVDRNLLKFIHREADLLLSTTIIESGLDVPNANTIFINEGQNYGLADLHQLRGRVGRSHHRAYCYVVVDPTAMINTEAQRRLKALEEFSHLGAGFQIALRDLEIRGAGNLLGSEQSGHIAAVGYELYCQLLENAVRTLKKQPIQNFLDVTIELPWQAFFPAAYLVGERYRIDAYRRLARLRDLAELKGFRQELADRFGPPPEPAANMLHLAELRLLAQPWQLESVRPDDGGFLVLSSRQRRRLETLASLHPRQLRLVDAQTAYLPIAPQQRHARGYAQILKSLLLPNR